MLIKVCGMKDGENIRQTEALGADLIGLIFYSKSPRCVEYRPGYLPARARRVGVFVNAAADEICDRAAEYSLDYVQLHGTESPQFCRTLRARLPEDCGIIKALPVASGGDLAAADAYQECADMLLFDTKCPGHGGSGIKFDWSLLEGYGGRLPFLLSGGIGSGDAEALGTFIHPRFVGVDLNSRFESIPGVKDTALLQDFIREIKR